MRDPFKLPSGCPEITIVTDVLGALPFCSVPDFKTPTCVVRPPALVVPDIAAPDTCLAMMFRTSISTRLVRSHGPKPSARWGMLGDPCDANYVQVLELTVPCMPLAVKIGGSVKVLDDDPKLTLSMKKSASADDCGLSIKMGLEIPCIAFTVRPSTRIVMASGGDASGRIGMVKSPDSCEMTLTLDLAIPKSTIPAGTEFPCYIGDSDAEGSTFKSIEVVEA